MNGKAFILLIAEYLRRHRKTGIVFLIFAAIFFVVLSLYNYPTEAVLYAVLLCACTGLVFAGLGFMGFYKRHKLLHELLERITLSIDVLPAPRDLIEKDYQKLVETIHRDKIRLISDADNLRSEMIDYYTIWAHQIKTPIAAMRLLLQTGEGEQNDELSMELFRIEQYVDMVLQYLRMDSDSTDYVLRRYQLDDIVRQAVRKYAKVFVSKKIGLDYSALECTVLTDEKWLLFVIGQILSNSLKYTAAGKISIRMDPERSKTLVIEDTGIGIEAEDLPRVFEKGFTGYNGRTDKKSTGIGLYLCRRILTKLGHTISIESEVGCGTTVKIGLDTADIGL